MTQPFNKHTWAHYHIQKGNSDQKDMLQNSILRGKKTKTTTWRQTWFVTMKWKTTYTLQYAWSTKMRAHTQSQTQTPICFHGFCTDTYICQWGRRARSLAPESVPSAAGSTRRAGCLDRPEQGGQHRAHLPLSSINHQQLTLAQEETNGECLQGHLQNTAGAGRSLREHVRMKRFRQVGNSCERAFNPKVTEKDGSMKTPLLPSGFSEPLQIVLTLWAIPFCPLGTLHPSYLTFLSLSLFLCFSVSPPLSHLQNSFFLWLLPLSLQSDLSHFRWSWTHCYI